MVHAEYQVAHTALGHSVDPPTPPPSLIPPPPPVIALIRMSPLRTAAEVQIMHNKCDSAHCTPPHH